MTQAATNDLSTLLQKGLFEEEANRNLDAAISNYQSLANDFDKDRQLAATAVFRLGECYRKLGRTNEAVAQYQRIVREFSDQQTLATLSQQNLAGLGAITKSPSGQPMNEVLAQLMKQRAAEEGQLVTSDSLQQLQSDLTKTKADYDQQQTLVDTLTKMDRETLKKSLPTLVTDDQLNTLLSELDLAEQNLLQMKADYAQDHPKYLSAKASVDDLNRKIEDRMDGILIGLHAKLDAGKAHQAWIENEIHRLEGPANPQAVSEQTPITDEEEKEIRRIQQMIQNSPDLINAGSSGPDSNWTPLYQAAVSGWLRVATYLLDHGADVNLMSLHPGETPLYGAARKADKGMVELLLSRGADVNSKQHAAWTPLNVAAERGFLAVAETLLNHGADLAAVNDNGQTALHSAARAGHVEMIKLLLSHGANVDATDQSGSTPLNEAVLGRAPNAVTALLKANPDVNTIYANGETPLGLAAGDSYVDIAKSLLAAKADPNGGTTNLPLAGAIEFARSSEKSNLCYLLLSAGADPNKVAPVKNQYNVSFSASPIQLAVEEGQTEVVLLLLDDKANPNALDVASPHNATLLMQAVGSANARMAAALLAHGANVNARDDNGETALFGATRSGNFELTELLISNKADINVQNKDGNTPLDLARSSKPAGTTFPQRIMSLRSPGVTAPPTATSQHGDVAQLLREHGALDELPNFSLIRVTREGLSGPTFVFERQSNDWNHFTLLETLLQLYSRGQVWTGGVIMDPKESFKFPDLTRIIIHRPDRASVGKKKDITVNLLNGTNGIDCSRDLPLSFGDVVEIPMRNHNLDEQNVGLTKPQKEAITDCLTRTVRLTVRGQFRELKPRPSWAYLKSAVQLPEAQSLLLSSSDLAHVKVTRKDSTTGKTREFIVDASNSVQSPQDLWLENGDMIEVPDKTE